MTEKPIIFNDTEVRAILEGRKTQTRRIVKFNGAGRLSRYGKQWHVDDPEAINACPYGLAGSQMWVRETWGRGATRIMYRAGCNPSYRPPEGRWSPSIHMPRWASRITLEITDVRVERLQEISEHDACAEGVFRKTGSTDIGDMVETATGDLLIYAAPTQARESFQRLWNSINAKRGHGWKTNPRVWVIEFRQIIKSQPEKQTT